MMRSVEEIEAEIAKLTPAEVCRVARCLAEYKAELSDKQVKEYAAAGKLDRFIEHALEEHRKGIIIGLDPASSLGGCENRYGPCP
jgi:hypothetical protein